MGLTFRPTIFILTYFVLNSEALKYNMNYETPFINKRLRKTCVYKRQKGGNYTWEIDCIFNKTTSQDLAEPFEKPN